MTTNYTQYLTERRLRIEASIEQFTAALESSQLALSEVKVAEQLWSQFSGGNASAPNQTASQSEQRDLVLQVITANPQGIDTTGILKVMRENYGLSYGRWVIDDHRKALVKQGLVIEDGSQWRDKTGNRSILFKPNTAIKRRAA